MAEQGCTKVPDPDQPPFLRDHNKGNPTPLLLIDAAGTQPSLATSVNKPPNIPTLSVLESPRDDQDDPLDLVYSKART